jgi:glycosyltransferase involved in cell wall biosynthesis
MSDDRPWPKISIITPNYNYAGFLELTMRSVLLQGYPDLDYIIIDGGSTDGSVDIIRKYEKWLGHWISERDRGTSDALNKGFVAARGDVAALLCSDDVYTPGALEVVARAFSSGADCQIINGDVRVENVAEETTLVVRSGEVTFDRLIRYWNPGFIPPSIAVFFRRKVLEEVGLFNDALRYANDLDMWLRMARIYPFVYVPHVFAVYCIHPRSNSGQGWDKFEPEWALVARAYWGKPWHWRFWQVWVEMWVHRLSVWTRRLRELYIKAACEALLAGKRCRCLWHLSVVFACSPCFAIRGAKSLVLRALLGERTATRIKRFLGRS